MMEGGSGIWPAFWMIVWNFKAGDRVIIDIELLCKLKDIQI